MCGVEGCENRARTRGGKLCEKHYYRNYLHGSTDDPVPNDGNVPKPTSHGYSYVLVKDHPISPKSGVLYEHRMVLYDAIGPGPHACNWCGTRIDWGASGDSKLVVDHLDNDKQNNVLENLKPSCSRCNSNRGLFTSWVVQHKDDPFLAKIFAEAMNA